MVDKRTPAEEMKDLRVQVNDIGIDIAKQQKIVADANAKIAGFEVDRVAAMARFEYLAAQERR